MATIGKDLFIQAGENRTLTVTVVDEAGAKLNLTGATVYFSVKTLPQEGAYVFQKISSTPSQITILAQSGATLGQFEVYLVPSDTKFVLPKDYFYDAWVQVASGKRYAVFSPSQFTVVKTVTVI